MDRRSFLKNGSFALAAIAGIPLAIKKNNQVQPNVYSLMGVVDTASKLNITFKLFNDGILKTTYSSTSSFRKINVELSRLSSYNRNTKSTTICQYLIDSVDKDNTKTESYIVTAKLISEGKDHLGQNIKFIFRPNSSIKILNINSLKNFQLTHQSATKKDEPKTTTPAKKTNEDASDCFLTSACVFHKGLPDDCEELQKLRWLRDSFMLSTGNGKKLVKEYETDGPNLVSSIYSFENKKEILDYIYSSLVIPSIEMINDGHLQDAVDYYEAFVLKMKLNYTIKN